MAIEHDCPDCDWSGMDNLSYRRCPKCGSRAIRNFDEEFQEENDKSFDEAAYEAQFTDEQIRASMGRPDWDIEYADDETDDPNDID
jgi:predicted  nucleic acid-binding Zn-ribbon protein